MLKTVIASSIAAASYARQLHTCEEYNKCYNAGHYYSSKYSQAGPYAVYNYQYAGTMALNGMNYGPYFAGLEDNGDCGPKAYKVDCGLNAEVVTTSETGQLRFTLYSQPWLAAGLSPSGEVLECTASAYFRDYDPEGPNAPEYATAFSKLSIPLKLAVV